MDLLKRVLSAVVLIPIVVLALVLGGYYLIALTSICCVLMMVDVTSALHKGGFKPQRVVLLLTSAAVLPAILFKGLTGCFILAAVSFAIIATCVIFSKEPDFKSIISGGFALVYPLIPGALLVFLTADKAFSQSKLGVIICVAAILCACLSDTFAYFFGKMLGKKKLCPHISPKKTIVGSVASFFGGAVGGALMGLFLVELIAKAPIENIGLIDWVIIGTLCGGFAQIGDLTASMLKRFCNIKDYGKYIPGHGGIMDRMDSIITCLIAIITYLVIFIPEII